MLSFFRRLTPGKANGILESALYGKRVVHRGDGAAPQVETSPTTPLTPILIEPGDEAETILLS